jgi:formamidopyrimidine-DNA glycosylase
MPELPDITVYVEALQRRIVGQPVEEVRLRTPFLLRTVEPPIDALIGKRVMDVERLGKRIVVALEGDLFIVLHLMIAGRLHWRAPGAKGGGKSALAELAFRVARSR